jgi:hypothetical protein
MRQYAKLLMLLLVIPCGALTVRAQSVPEVAEKLKNSVKEKARCWKLFRQQERKTTEILEVELDWVCGKESVIVYLYQAPSVEAAAKMLYEILTSPVGSSARVPGAPPTDSYQFGDESSVGSYYLYTRSSYVFFRKGSIVARIDSGSARKTSSKRTLRNAVLFAQLLAEQMPPPNNGMHPTANSVAFMRETWP